MVGTDGDALATRVAVGGAGRDGAAVAGVVTMAGATVIGVPAVAGGVTMVGVTVAGVVTLVGVPAVGSARWACVSRSVQPWVGSGVGGPETVTSP